MINEIIMDDCDTLFPIPELAGKLLPDEGLVYFHSPADHFARQCGVLEFVFHHPGFSYRIPLMFCSIH
jgi:hypothetical protein